MLTPKNYIVLERRAGQEAFRGLSLREKFPDFEKMY